MYKIQSEPCLPLSEQGCLSVRGQAPSASGRRLRTILITCFYCIATAFFTISFVLSFGRAPSTSLHHVSVLSTVNTTLEFGAIYAVSRKDSPRRPILERAAGLTELEIKVPTQPIWSEEQVQAVRAQENSTLSRGSALAWLGHLNVLKRFLDSPYETALIVEDDVDFDTHIRTEQIPITAYAIRELLGAQGNSNSYYGDTKLWDILWLGHCGDEFDANQAISILPIKVFTDLTLPIFKNLHPWTQNFLQGLSATTEQQRLVHKSVNPLCTFAYAVTRHAATRLVNDFAAREPSRPADQSCPAFDVRMLEACRDGQFSCVTVTPELFHHTATPSEIAEVTAAYPDKDIEDDEGLDTPNIRCSATSDLWWNSKRRPYDYPRIVARDRAMSAIAQQPGFCYLDQFKHQ